MGAIRFRGAEPRLAAAALVVLGLAVPTSRGPLRDAPVRWWDDDRQDIAQPTFRDVNIIRSAVDATLFRPLGRLFHPGRFVRRVGSVFGGEVAPPAANVNRLDEVPNSSWFTNRIGLFPMSPQAAARGPLRSPGPDISAPWQVISVKTRGVTPGFNIRDARGDTYVIKFDPPGFRGSSTAAGVVSGRILHAAGYNVPEDVVVEFARDRLQLAPDVPFTARDGTERRMTPRDLDAILERAERDERGRWRALASRFLEGTSVGPFDWRGRRHDDPNDRIDHADRRELRALRMFAAWICHYDTKQDNTLDVYVEEDGRRFVRHYLIDFASTLGASAVDPFRAGCWEYSFDPVMIGVRALTVGLYEDPFRRIERPAGLDEVGYFQAEGFHPMAFKALEPNSAFANMTARDGYWAAKIISAFTDVQLTAIVAEGRYRNPEAARWIARVLGERRDVIARYWFDRVPPLDFFTVEGNMLRFHDLGVERGVYSAGARYRARIAAVSVDRVRASDPEWQEIASTTIDLAPASRASSAADYPFFEVEIAIHRNGRWSGAVTAFVARESGRVVGVER